MDFMYNINRGCCELDKAPLEFKLQQQVWPGAAQNQNISYTSVAVASPQNSSYDAQASTSCSPFSEGATDADWDASLFGPAHSIPDTPVSIQSTSFVEPEIKPLKRHYAHITFVPSINGLKPVVSRKRKRTAFTTDQVNTLEEVFQRKPYVTREDRNVLVQKLAVADQAIKVWFQNRRLRQKKEMEEEQEAVQYQEHNMFAHTELLLHRVDKNGRVALNQQAIDELVTAMDAFLPQDLDLGELLCDSRKVEKPEKISTFTDTIHEPISPPEFASELKNCSQEWWSLEVIDPKQSLQRLLDVHRSL